MEKFNFCTLENYFKDFEKVEAVKKIFGKQTLDGDTGQVGPELAQRMNIPFIGYVSEIMEISDKKIKVKRLAEDRYEIFEVRLPAAISVIKDINTPRVPSLRGNISSGQATLNSDTLLELDEIAREERSYLIDYGIFK
mgnify:CR=1 FL=1